MNKLVKKRANTKLKQLDLSGYYTYTDYLTWQFKERVELIKGMIFKISPAPNLKHRRISIKLSAKLDIHGRNWVLSPSIFVISLNYSL